VGPMLSKPASGLNPPHDGLEVRLWPRGISLVRPTTQKDARSPGDIEEALRLVSESRRSREGFETKLLDQFLFLSLGEHLDLAFDPQGRAFRADCPDKHKQ
jgi:hypothetical protein